MRIEASDLESLKPLIAAIVRETLAQVGPAANGHDPQIYTEAEAAKLLKLRPWQLRDERRRQRIGHSRGPRNRVLYRREDIEEYLASRAG